MNNQTEEKLDNPVNISRYTQFSFTHRSHAVYNSDLSDAAEMTRTKTIVRVRKVTKT
jgi:hypothetical protein